MNAAARLKLIHESVDKFNSNNKEAMKARKKLTPADNLFAELVQGPYVHALVDARVKHNMPMIDIEEAVCALAANMMSLLISSALSQDAGLIALMLGKRMSEKLDDYLYDAIASNFHNTGEEPTNDDKIH
jgi:hypothetical protein